MSDFAALAYRSSRFRGVGTLLSSHSESMRSLGSAGCLSDLSDFCVSSYGSASAIRLETEQSPMDSTEDPPCEPKNEP